MVVKKLSVAVLMAALVVWIGLNACNQKPKVTVVHGEILPVPTIPLNTITLIYSTDDSLKKYDSIKTGIDGKFQFTIDTKEPQPIYLVIRETQEMAMAFVEGDSLHIQAKIGELKNMKAEGGSIQKEWNSYITTMMPYTILTDSLSRKAQAAPSEAEYMAVKEAIDALQPKVTQSLNTFLKEHGNSIVAAIIVYNNAMYVDDYNWIKEMYSFLGEKAKTNKFGIRVQQKIDKLSKTQIGGIAPDFSSTTPDGKTLKLSDLRGKYVLLDFWASWCGPCRKENPNVVKAYNMYKDKNFEILGVSLDDSSSQKAWLEAIEKDKLTWKQVSDLKGWESSVAEAYSIMSIPNNFLLDKNGKIVAKNLREDSLHIVLEKVLNTQQ